jgi:hypothetical protein
MEFLINNAIEMFSDKIIKKCNDIEKKLELIHKKIDNQTEKLEKLENNLLEISIVISQSNKNISTMEEVD